MKKRRFALRALVATAAVALGLAAGVSTAWAAPRYTPEETVEKTGKAVAAIVNADGSETKFGSVLDAFNAISSDDPVTVKLLADTKASEGKDGLSAEEISNRYLLGSYWIDFIYPHRQANNGSLPNQYVSNFIIPDNSPLPPNDKNELVEASKRNIVIDLNGHEFYLGGNLSNHGVRHFIIENGCTVTIRDSSDSGSGVFNGPIDVTSDIYAHNGRIVDIGHLIIEGGAFKSDYSEVFTGSDFDGSPITQVKYDTSSLVSASTGATVDIKGGSFSASQYNDCVLNVSTAYGSNNVTISGGTLISEKNPAIIVDTFSNRKNKKYSNSLVIKADRDSVPSITSREDAAITVSTGEPGNVAVGTTISIEGGKLSGATSSVAFDGSAKSYNLNISGGTFEGKLDLASTASSYSVSSGHFSDPVKKEWLDDQTKDSIKDATDYYFIGNLSDELDVSQFKDADSAQLVAPEVDGKAFAGWYKDADLSTAYTKDEISSATKAYAKFVNAYSGMDADAHDGVINFIGGALRYGVYVENGALSTTKTDLRFSYNFVVPDGCERVAWGWNYGKTESLGAIAYGKTERSAEGTHQYSNDPAWATKGYFSNIVLSELSGSLLSSDLYSQPFVTYTTKDGTKVTVKGDIEHRSVQQIAQAIVDGSQESDFVKSYAKGLLNTIGSLS